MSISVGQKAPDFTLQNQDKKEVKLSDYAALGGHMDHVRPLASLKPNTETLHLTAPPTLPGSRP